MSTDDYSPKHRGEPDDASEAQDEVYEPRHRRDSSEEVIER